MGYYSRSYSNNNSEGSLIASIVLLVITIIIVMGAKSCNDAQDNAKYNDGIHQDCGGHLVYQQAVGHKNSTSYIFRCDKCGEILELDSDAVTPIYFEDGFSIETTETTETTFDDNFETGPNGFFVIETTEELEEEE